MMTLFSRNINKYGKQIDLEDRELTPVANKAVMAFTNPIPMRGIVSTVSGVRVFDDVNTERDVTHKICIAASRKVIIATITESGLIATVTTAIPHLLLDGQVGNITGALQAAYNVSGAIITIISPSIFTYEVGSSTGGAATGNPIFTYLLPDVTKEKWIRFRNRHIKILTAENCCEDDEVWIFQCTERGQDVKDANKA